MPPRKKQVLTKRKQKDTDDESDNDIDPESALRTVYATHFMHAKITDSSPILPSLQAACKSLKITFVPFVRSTEETMDTYSLEEFRRDLWRMRHFGEDTDFYEFIFDLMSENGMISREDERGYVKEERLPLKELYITPASFVRGVQRLNQRIPGTTFPWMLQLLVTDLKDLNDDQVMEVQREVKYPFKHKVKWEQFTRFLFNEQMLDERMPKALQAKLKK